MASKTKKPDAPPASWQEDVHLQAAQSRLAELTAEQADLEALILDAEHDPVATQTGLDAQAKIVLDGDGAADAPNIATLRERSAVLGRAIDLQKDRVGLARRAAQGNLARRLRPEYAELLAAVVEDTERLEGSIGAAEAFVAEHRLREHLPNVAAAGTLFVPGAWRPRLKGYRDRLQVCIGHLSH